MKIVYITAGAAGMFCGSCMRDNTLVSALYHLGHDAILLPTYTPIRTDEEDVSQSRVFFGGINVYLQQKVGLFRHTPWFLDRLLDGRGLLNWVSRFAVKTEAQELGELTISMLKGDHGYQRKEIVKLAAYLADEFKPEVINLTNALLSGMVPELKRRLPAPILCSLQGDDIFLESLPEPYRTQCLELVRDNCKQIDGFIATSAYYADFMSGYFAVPRERIHVVHPGLNLQGHGGERRRAASGRRRSATSRASVRKKGCTNSWRRFCLCAATRRTGVQVARLRLAGRQQQGILRRSTKAPGKRGPAPRFHAHRDAGPREQGAFLPRHRRAMRADDVSRAERDIHSRSVGERRAGGAAAATARFPN